MRIAVSLPTAVISVLLTFLGTVLIGNFLIQRWNQLNWLTQQKFAGAEKDYLALKELAEEVARLAAHRLLRMQRLLSAIGKDAAVLKQRLHEYDEAQASWNEKLGSFNVRFAMYANYNMALRLEREVQNRFRRAGIALEVFVEAALGGRAVTQAETVRVRRELNRIQGLLFEFNRDLLKLVKNRETLIYEGMPIPFRRKNLNAFSTWYLFKALFIADVQSLTILRPASNHA
jgi:hypothetical protein